MEKPKIQPYIRTKDLAAQWKVDRRTIVAIFKRRTGVIKVPYRKGFFLLIPSSDTDDYVWTLDELVDEFRLSKRVLRQLFRGEAGVFRIDNELRVPETVRLKVFERYRNP